MSRIMGRSSEDAALSEGALPAPEALMPNAEMPEGFQPRRQTFTAEATRISASAGMRTGLGTSNLRVGPPIRPTLDGSRQAFGQILGLAVR